MAANDAFLARAIVLVRDFCQEAADEVRWTEAKIVRLVDTANALVYEELLAAMEPNSVMRFAESAANIVAAQEDYDYPGNFRKFVQLVKKNSSGWITSEIRPVPFLSGFAGVVLFDKRRGYRIVPKPTASDSDWYLVYEAGVIPYLHYGTAASATGTTLVLDSTPSAGTISQRDDFYNNGYIRIVSATT